MKRDLLRFDKVFGLIMVFSSLGIAVLASAYFGILERSIPVSILAWPAVGFLVGLFVVLSDQLEISLGLEDEIEELPDSVTTSWKMLVRGSLSNAHGYMLVTIAGIVTQFYLIFHHQKWLARWGGINVMIVALFVVVVTWIVIFRTPWFQLRRKSFRSSVFFIPAVAWLLCAVIGVYYTEPRLENMSRLERREVIESGTYWSNTRSGGSRFFNSVSSDGFYFDFDFDCDDEGCLILILVAIAVICIIATVMIPHFWVVATLLLLTIMAGIALRELLYLGRQADT